MEHWIRLWFIQAWLCCTMSDNAQLCCQLRTLVPTWLRARNTEGRQGRGGGKPFFQGLEVNTGVTKGTLGVHSSGGRARKGDSSARGEVDGPSKWDVVCWWCVVTLRRLGKLCRGGREELALVGWGQASFAG